MIIRRTSITAFLIAVVLFLVYLLTSRAAESYYQATKTINFGIHSGRPWNPWDFVAFPAIFLSVVFVVVGLMFLHNDD